MEASGQLHSLATLTSGEKATGEEDGWDPQENHHKTLVYILSFNVIILSSVFYNPKSHTI